MRPLPALTCALLACLAAPAAAQTCTVCGEVRSVREVSALRDALQRGTVKAELVSIKTRDEGLALLREGQVQGLASDRTALIGVVVMSGRGGGQFKLLDQDFSIEQYALMLRRNDADFRLAVNRVLARVYRSGEIEKIYGRWLGPLGPPSMLLSATYFIQNLAE